MFRLSKTALRGIQIGLVFGGILSTAPAFANAQLPGGETTVIVATENSFSLPLKNAVSETRRRFAIGNALFNQNWVEAPASVDLFDGLGPLFNAQSCSGCHFKDGRASPIDKNGDMARGLLFRINHDKYGDQIQPLSILGVEPEARVLVKYKKIHGQFKDGEKFVLQDPEYSFKDLKYGPLPKDIPVSPRIAPQVIGLGLLEAILEADLRKNEDPLDANKDGISGRANLVFNPFTLKNEMGRFGWKANQASLKSQDASALSGDMGLTTTVFPQQNCTSAQPACLKAVSGGNPEMSDDNLESLNVYTQALAVPAARVLPEEIRGQGEKLFQELQCAGCHVPSYKTGNTHALKELRDQLIFPYTDLLLHDMGEALQDRRPDFEATGSEWRTPPLWGIGLIPTVNRHSRLLHDGRARNVQEAILWHGGEAEGAREKFKNITKAQRQVLLRFVESL